MNTLNVSHNHAWSQWLLKKLSLKVVDWQKIRGGGGVVFDAGNGSLLKVMHSLGEVYKRGIQNDKLHPYSEVQRQEIY